MDSFVIPLSDLGATDPERVGPKAANLAALAAAGLPTPGGFALTADAYRRQIARLGLDEAVASFADADMRQQRRSSVEIRLKLYQQPIAPEILAPLMDAWRAQRATCGHAIRSSALIEDRADANFAGQFESFLGIVDEAEFLIAVRACWAALWTSNARRYMENHGLDPAIDRDGGADPAHGGGARVRRRLERDRRRPDADQCHLGARLRDRAGRGGARSHRAQSAGLRAHDRGRPQGSPRDLRTHGHGRREAVPKALVREPCLDAGQAVTLGRLIRKAEALMGMPVEIEWALDDEGFKLLQSRPLHVQPAHVPDEIWLKHPGLNGHPAGIGWGSGRAVVVSCECELARVAPGDILVTKVAGPALSHILPRVAGVVAELGGSTSHLASLARERGIPMVLGVLDATRQIPDGSQVAVDGVAGVVRWLR